MSFKTPILFIIYNRPELTKKVFEQIRILEPSKLFIAADGPKASEKDFANCNATRKIIESISWPCDIKTLYSDKNLGCKFGEYTAISWFFNQVDEGIILEDDTLPNQSFFRFCQLLLEYYRNDNRIMHISGCNLGLDCINFEYSYFFSKYIETWGWASWKRAWKLYDIRMKLWPKIKKELFLYYKDTKEIKYRLNQFNTAYYGNADTYDYAWYFAVLVNNGLSIIPKYNMITNIGFDSDATHTRNKNDKFGKLETVEYWELKHPKHIAFNHKFERFKSRNLKKSIFSRLFKFIKNILYYEY